MRASRDHHTFRCLGLWLLSASHGLAADDAPGGWTTLQDEQVHIACGTVDGARVCRAQAIFPVSPADLVKVVADVDRYPDHFVRITRAVRRDDLVILDVDLPSLLPVKTWTLRWVASTEGQDTVFLFDSETPMAHGSIRISPDPSGARITYQWQAAALPEFLSRPSSRMHGHNMLWGFALALATSPTAPDDAP